ncbi:MAG: sugar phosphate isomerase/epimerase [Planctomycetes bacterium]|nr:sugar phosphate isomerase/epimerase [Planctomycetota bacterium]
MADPKLGMMTYSFNRMVRDEEIDVAGIIRFCGELGVQEMDVGEAHWIDPAKDIPATLEAMEETGIGVASSHTALDLVTRTDEARTERETKLREICERLAAVKARCIMLGSPTNDLSPEEWRKEFGVGLAEAIPIAEEYGLTVTFENRGGPAGRMVGTVEHCLEIMGHANDSRLRFTFDVGNFRYVGADWDDAFGRLADTIAHVHLKDVAPKGESFQMVPLGEGEVDNAPTIRKLMERGYTGSLAIECGGRGTDKEDAAKSVEFVKGVLR